MSVNLFLRVWSVAVAESEGGLTGLPHLNTDTDFGGMCSNVRRRRTMLLKSHRTRIEEVVLQSFFLKRSRYLVALLRPRLHEQIMCDLLAQILTELLHMDPKFGQSQATLFAHVNPA